MIRNMNLSEARRESVGPGGYVCRVLDTNIDEKYNRLQLKVDITEGDNAGYFSRLDEKYSFWGLTANLYLDDKSTWKFANAIDAFKQSNPDFTWNDDAENDERTLIGKYVGIIAQRKHYLGNDGKEKTKLLVYRLVPADVVRSGQFDTPKDVYADELKNATPASTEVVDYTMPQGFVESADEMPF